MDWRNKLLRIQQNDGPGDVRYDGPAAHFDDPELVPWPGIYATPEGVLDPSKRLVWVEEVPDDPDHSGGWWELDLDHPSQQLSSPVVPLQAEVSARSRTEV